MIVTQIAEYEINEPWLQPTDAASVLDTSCNLSKQSSSYTIKYSSLLLDPYKTNTEGTISTTSAYAIKAKHVMQALGKQRTMICINHVNFVSKLLN